MHFKIEFQIRCYNVIKYQSIQVLFNVLSDNTSELCLRIVHYRPKNVSRTEITISIFDELIHSIVHVDYYCCDDRNFSAFTHTTSYLIRRYKTHSKHQFES